MRSPVFLLLSERSGSNLLRTLLSNHAQLSGPLAPQFFMTFDHRLKAYGDLREPDNCIALLKDMINLSRLALYAWQMDGDAAEFYARHKPASLPECVHHLYQYQASREGAATYVCKENNLIDYASSLFECGTEPRFIYLYRDPRDYLASISKHPEFGLTVYAAINKWVKEQEQCLAFQAAHTDLVHCLSYEELVATTEEALTGVLEFLRLPVDPACFLTNTKKNEALAWNPLWENLRKDVMRDNFGKFAETLSSREIHMAETVAKPLMERFGYDLTTKAGWKKPLWFKYSQRSKQRALIAERAVVQSDAYLERDHFISGLPSA